MTQDYLTRSQTIARIRTALKTKTGRNWSVSGGRGTAWGWIRIEAQPKDRVCHDDNPAYDWHNRVSGIPPYIDRKPEHGELAYYTSASDCKILAQALGLDRPVHFQGQSISPDERALFVQRAEAGL